MPFLTHGAFQFPHLKMAYQFEDEAKKHPVGSREHHRLMLEHHRLMEFHRYEQGAPSLQDNHRRQANEHEWAYKHPGKKRPWWHRAYHG